MCGRYSLTAPSESLKRLFGLSLSNFLPAQFNIAPSARILVVRGNRNIFIPTFMNWGWKPSWTLNTEIKSQIINARAETLHEKPMFSESYKKRRCLVLADGFYEWKKVQKHKVPYRIAIGNEEPFAFAGIWDERIGQGGKVFGSVVILTTAANDAVARVHHRMPVIIPNALYFNWLDSSEIIDLSQFIRLAYPRQRVYRVSMAVNNPNHDQATCVLELDRAKRVNSAGLDINNCTDYDIQEELF